MAPSRKIAIASRRSGWAGRIFFGSPPYNFATQSCEYFWPPRPIEEADIQTRAYHIWQNQGCPEGKEEEHWLQARRECEEARRRWG
ncbi:MAG: DUF2934 domain-containing protein [Oscillatoria princeps RMCB-10]|nr:DUF2934 domain-containing protein [Oscillatoria princeps RMCB-10]